MTFDKTIRYVKDFFTLGKGWCVYQLLYQSFDDIAKVGYKNI